MKSRRRFALKATNEPNMKKSRTVRNLKANQVRKNRLTRLTDSPDLDTVERAKLHRIALAASKKMTLDEVAEYAGHSKGWWSWVVRAKSIHSKEWKNVHPTLVDLAAIESTMLVMNASKRKSERKILAARDVLQLVALLRKAAYVLIAEEMR